MEFMESVLYWKWNAGCLSGYRMAISVSTLVIRWLTGSYLCSASRERIYHTSHTSLARKKFKMWSKNITFYWLHISMPHHKVGKSCWSIVSQGPSVFYFINLLTHVPESPCFNDYRLLLWHRGVVLYIPWLFWLLILIEETGPWGRFPSPRRKALCHGSACFVLGVSPPCPLQLTKAARVRVPSATSPAAHAGAILSRARAPGLLPTGSAHRWAVGEWGHPAKDHIPSGPGSRVRGHSSRTCFC